jgi:hypothetical protein
MWGQLYFDGLDNGLCTTISGGLTKFSQIAGILKYHKYHCSSKSCVNSITDLCDPQILVDCQQLIATMIFLSSLIYPSVIIVLINIFLTRQTTVIKST